MTEPADKTTFLVCFDYQKGGLWCLVDARNADEIRALHPQLYVVEKDPPWIVQMTRKAFDAKCETNGNHWDIDAPPELWQRVLAQR